MKKASLFVVFIALVVLGIVFWRMNPTQEDVETAIESLESEHLVTADESERQGQDYVAESIVFELVGAEPIVIDTAEIDNAQYFLSDDLGFSLQYPADWLINEEYEAEGLVCLISQEHQDKMNDPELEGVPFNMCLVDVKEYQELTDLPNNKEGLSFEEWIDIKANDYLFIKREPIVLGGAMGYQGECWGMISVYCVFIENDGRVYSASTSDTNQAEEIEIIHSIQFAE